MKVTFISMIALGLLAFSPCAFSADPPGPKANVGCDKKANGEDAKSIEAQAEEACKSAGDKAKCKKEFIDKRKSAS